MIQGIPNKSFDFDMKIYIADICFNTYKCKYHGV